MKKSFLSYFTLVVILLGVLFFSSCNDDLSNEIRPDEENKVQFNSEGYAVENGYLSFVSQSAFENLFNNVEEALNNEDLLKSGQSVIPNIKGFVSSANKINQTRLKSSSEQGVENEIYAEVQSSLIPTEVIHHLVDTLNRVKVEENIYQVTMFGTFIYNNDKTEEFNELLNSFPDEMFNYTSQIDSITYSFGNIKMIDTYKHIENGTFNEDVVLGILSDDEETQENSTSSLKSSSDRFDKINSTFTSRYGLNNHGIRGGFFNNNWRSNYFDSKTRVRAKLYSYNFGVYKGAGFICKFQKKKSKTVRIKYWWWGWKRKTITLYTYWSSTTNPEMVIGMDYFEGYTEYTDFGMSVGSNGFPISYNHHKTFAGGIASLFKVSTSSYFEEVRGWASRGWLFDTKLQLNVLGMDRNLLLDAYNAGNNALISEVRSLAEKGINKAAPTRYVKRDEKMYPNRKWVVYSGVKKYYNRGYISISLGLPSFGIGVLPNQFHIKEAFVFGAAKHNGKWEGVRLYFR